MSCGGFNVFYLSISLLVLFIFLIPLNRILGNFVIIKEIMCKCAYFQAILIQFFFFVLHTF